MKIECIPPDDEAGDRKASASPTPACSESTNLDQLTADAQALLARLGSNDAEHIRLALEFGSLIARARKSVPHGEFQKWCSDDLDRSPTWCSMYRRLFENRDDLESAQKWASATQHKWAKCRSVERLLALINEYKKTKVAAPDKPPRRRAAPDGVATLEKRLRGCEKTFVALFEALSPHWVARAKKLAAAADDGPDKSLGELALRIRARASDPGETCSALQVSPPEAASRHPGKEGGADDETVEAAGVLQ